MSDQTSLTAPKLLRVKVKGCKLVCRDPATCYIPSLNSATFSLTASPPVTLTTPVKCVTHMHLTHVLPSWPQSSLPPSLSFVLTLSPWGPLSPLLYLVTSHHSSTFDIPSLTHFYSYHLTFHQYSPSGPFFLSPSDKTYCLQEQEFFIALSSLARTVSDTQFST